MTTQPRQARTRRFDLDWVLSAFGWLVAAVVAVATVTSGLPADAPAAVAVALGTTVGLALWCAALLTDEPRVLTGCLVAVGVSGSVVNGANLDGPGYLLCFMASAGIGMRLRGRRSVVAVGVVVVAAMLSELISSRSPVIWGLGIGVGTVFVFLVGRFAAAQQRASAQAVELLAQREATRAAQQEAAVLEERTRIARELHDVLAHTLAGLTVQLEGARLMAESTGADPRLVDQISSARRLAVDGATDAKNAVATLRGEPIPGPGDLQPLVEASRKGGLQVDLQVSGQPRPLSPEAGLAIYRTAQEGLTNAAKHAGTQAHVRVSLSWQEGTVCLEVRDSAGRDRTASLGRSGFGLSGLGERASLLGGHVDSGPTEPAGWRVATTLPLAAAVPADAAAGVA